ncbi:hypothetical protein MTX78_25110 (plasmid) [Hymenobacter tibetensis]|uniref:STAS/SEC14 domain-containing protein n=1 Tax=Hymenobacter tibetensis TaxID=497967 RepID=A0ABY4D5B2_9BACT|nr:hypothetical protein [Hymenobacter tibetensis]UOG77689.1 hypothetical protein MTX78_25110 [Hymenobacter tibetensis]
MEKPILLPAGELQICPEGYIHLIWAPESLDSDAAQAVFTEVLRLLQRTGYSKLLTDQRQRATASEAYMGWLLAIWLTQVGGGGHLTHVAVVPARALDLRLQAVDVCRQGQYRYGIMSQFFDTPEAASQWLLTSG